MSKLPEIVVVDNYLDNPDDFRRIALGLKYELSDYHKGRRTKERFVNDTTFEDFGKLLGRKVTKWQEHGMNGKFQICLSGEQIVFHSDLQTHAGIIFLSPDAPVDCGLSLYRSKINGLRRNPENDKEAAVEMYEGNLLDRSKWEEIDRVGNIYNRLVLWDGQLVHAPSGYFGNCLENGRLFQIFFFDCE